jgi:nucleoside-diphosphate-sugar epimerase
VLGFQPRIAFRDGARDTAEWYARQGLLGRPA